MRDGETHSSTCAYSNKTRIRSTSASWGAVSAVGLIERFVDAPESRGAVPFYWRCGFDPAASSCAAEETGLLVGWPGRLRQCILIC